MPPSFISLAFCAAIRGGERRIWQMSHPWQSCPHPWGRRVEGLEETPSVGILRRAVLARRSLSREQAKEKIQTASPREFASAATASNFRYAPRLAAAITAKIDLRGHPRNAPCPTNKEDNRALTRASRCFAPSKQPRPSFLLRLYPPAPHSFAVHRSRSRLRAGRGLR